MRDYLRLVAIVVPVVTVMMIAARYGYQRESWIVFLTIAIPVSLLIRRHNLRKKARNSVK